MAYIRLASVKILLSLTAVGSEIHDPRRTIFSPSLSVAQSLIYDIDRSEAKLNRSHKIHTNGADSTVEWCRRFDPGGSLDRRVKLSLCAPAQMGWREMEHKVGKNRGSCYPAPEWVRLQ
jgi:hypothetical protein